MFEIQFAIQTKRILEITLVRNLEHFIKIHTRKLRVSKFHNFRIYKIQRSNPRGRWILEDHW